MWEVIIVVVVLLILMHFTCSCGGRGREYACSGPGVGTSRSPYCSVHPAGQKCTQDPKSKYWGCINPNDDAKTPPIWYAT